MNLPSCVKKISYLRMYYIKSDQNSLAFIVSLSFTGLEGGERLHWIVGRVVSLTVFELPHSRWLHHIPAGPDTVSLGAHYLPHGP